MNRMISSWCTNILKNPSLSIQCHPIYNHTPKSIILIYVGPSYSKMVSFIQEVTPIFSSNSITRSGQLHLYLSLKKNCITHLLLSFKRSFIYIVKESSMEHFHQNLYSSSKMEIYLLEIGFTDKKLITLVSRMI